MVYHGINYLLNRGTRDKPWLIMFNACSGKFAEVCIILHEYHGEPY